MIIYRTFQRYHDAISKKVNRITILVIACIILGSCKHSGDGNNPHTGTPEQLASGLQGSFGSSIGPDGAIYIPEAGTGNITRLDPETGATSTFASGLPALIPAVGIGGAMDIAFIDQTAYVLITLVGPDVGGSNVSGIYRIDDPENFTIIADIGAYAIANPPATDYAIPSGLQFAMQPYNDGFLVTDGHHNRILHVTLNGDISDFKTFDNIVPTGLAISGNRIYMAESGPTPHLPEDGKVISFTSSSSPISNVASGGQLLVDVEPNSDHSLFTLSQGVWDGQAAGSPANPNTGTLASIRPDGTLSPVTGNLDRPTSLEFIGHTAFIITLGGEVWKITNVTGN